MTPKQKSYENLAHTVIKALEKRNFEALYVPTGAEALQEIMGRLTPSSTVACGGSVTLEEIGFPKALAASECTFLDRYAPTTPEEQDAMFARIAVCDYYLMSSNAISADGQLVNIDNTGNRVASLIHGPKHVIVVAGMNKVCADLPSAYKRVKLCAVPPNNCRLERSTPCAVTGICADCLGPDCICANTVITRRCTVPGRITVILVGEELGY